MKKFEKKYFEEGDTVSLIHSFDVTHSFYVTHFQSAPFDVKKNCFIYNCTKDYYYLCKIKNAKIYFIKTRKNLKNNVFSSRNLLIEKRIFSFLPRYFIKQI